MTDAVRAVPAPEFEAVIERRLDYYSVMVFPFPRRAFDPSITSSVAFSRWGARWLAKRLIRKAYRMKRDTSARIERIQG